jgi:hypothetical protein
MDNPNPYVDDSAIPRASLDQMVEYFSELLKPWGGPKGFARHWKIVFDSAKKGSPTQLRALEKIVDVMKMIHDLAPAQTDVDEMSEEELKIEAAQLIK